MAGQAFVERATPGKTQFSVDVNDIHTGGDGVTQVPIVGS